MGAILENPAAWATALTILVGAPLGAAIRWLRDLQKRVEACEQERAVLKAELNMTNRDLMVERGRVNVLTDLFKKEANLG